MKLPLASRWVVLAAFLGVEARAQIDGGGGPVGPHQGDCISDADRALAQQLITDYERQFGPRSVASVAGTPPKLTFFPLAGRLWADLFIVNYVDLDATGGFQDWDCTDWSYDGHNGSDTDIRSFGEQIIGVPVYAAEDGTVIATHDGEDDMNTVWAGQPANFVIVDHGLGREGWYFHLKKNSVAVSMGQPVSAGHQVGLCASSGVSTGPHLHFELRDNGVPYEPFAGPCHAGDSGWESQPYLDRSAYLHDFGVTHEDISAAGPWPYEWPRTGQIAQTDPVIRVWWYGTALPAASHWKVQFKRPNGTIIDRPNQNFTSGFNPNPFWRWYNWWWTYSLPGDMQSIAGTWHVRLLINDVVALEAPIEVVAIRDPDFNRPPFPVTVHFEPSQPQPGDVLSCVVNTSLTLDDLDYDIVRYEYVWTVNGQEVRHVTTAAHSDVLSRDLLSDNAQVVCSVTPSDGADEGPVAMKSVTVREPVIPAASTWGLLVLAILLLIAGSIIAAPVSRRFDPHR
jgi:murein DD-endopeptidase MepM/ murein hydrolase activator NlpD